MQQAIGQGVTPFGNYPVKSYRSTDFDAPAQIFSTAQNNNGEMFFANNNGILSFNGREWNKIVASSKEDKINALDQDENGVVYFGGVSNFGYLAIDSVGSYYPVVLSSLESENNEKINGVFCLKDNVFFLMDDSYFVYNVLSKEVKPHSLPEGVSVTAAFKTYNKVILYTTKKSDELVEHTISVLDESGIKSTPNKRKISSELYRTALDRGSELVGVYQIKNNYYFFDRNGKVHVTNNLYEKELEEASGFAKEGYYKGSLNNVGFSNGSFWFGTDESGLICYDLNGKFIRKLNLNNGLTDLNIINMFIDKDENLWLNFNKGIDIIELNAPIRSYDYKTKFYESVENTYADEHQRLMLTLQKVLKVDENGSFHSIPLKNSKAECFDVKVVGEDVMIVAYDGILKLNPDDTDSLMNGLVAWKMEPSLDDENVLFVGLDNHGVARMEKVGGSWTTEPFIDSNLFGVVRSLSYFDHKLYFSLQGKGVYSWDDKLKLYSKLKLDAEVSEGDGFVVEKFDDELWVGSERGLHKVEDGEVVSYNPIEGLSDTNTYVHRMYNDGQGKLWLVLFQNYKGKNGKSEQREIGYIEKVNGVYSYVSRPFKKLKKSTIHSISRWQDEVWFGGPEGLFYHQMNQDKTYDNEFEVLVDFFDPMHKKDSSTIFKNYTEFLKTTDFQIPHLNNYIKLKLACPQYFGGSQNEFRFLLEGYDGAWSDWSAIGDKVYSRLPHGSYILKFQARNYYGMESDVKEIRFTILPPWYFTWWAYLLYFVGAIFIIVLVARLSVNRVKQQKIHLEEVVKERTSEIAEQNNQLEHQKAEIIEKSNDILDSIKYAERIQQTILPADEFMEEMFEEHFVLFKPKDIVSGDFYWAAVSKKMFLFSAIDCTGHGVPGAFVSIVGHNGLTRAIKEFGHSKPSDILDTLREIVIDAFKGQGKADVKDGMDIALCGIDYENMVLHFAGAHNPCIIVRSGEMIEIKADKQPIGQFEYGKPFTAHEFNLKKGDVIYTYTDGYIDQFGGLKGKKFKSRPFKNLLLEIVDLPMDEQRAILDTRFIEWCGEHEQIDDVCVFGVRI